VRIFDTMSSRNRYRTQTNDCCIRWRRARHWAAEFRRGRRSFQDEPRSGRPYEALCDENCHAVENVVLQNRRVNVQLIADGVGVSAGRVKTILCEHLLMTKICARYDAAVSHVTARYVSSTVETMFSISASPRLVARCLNGPLVPITIPLLLRLSCTVSEIFTSNSNVPLKSGLRVVHGHHHHHHVRLLKKSCHNATCTWKEIKIKHIKNTTSYLYAIVSIAPTFTIFKLLDVEEYRDLEGSLRVIGNDRFIRSHGTSL